MPYSILKIPKKWSFYLAMSKIFIFGVRILKNRTNKNMIKTIFMNFNVIFVIYTEFDIKI